VDNVVVAVTAEFLLDAQGFCRRRIHLVRGDGEVIVVKNDFTGACHGAKAPGAKTVVTGEGQFAH